MKKTTNKKTIIATIAIITTLTTGAVSFATQHFDGLRELYGEHPNLTVQNKTAINQSSVVSGVKMTVTESIISDKGAVIVATFEREDGKVFEKDAVVPTIEITNRKDLSYMIDPTAKPPLNININSGKQILDGKKALQFLRYRKGNNKQGYVDGDLGRIKAQQQFLTSFITKTSENLLTVVTKGIGYVKTDINIIDSFVYAKKALGMTKDDFKFDILPGKAEFKKVNKKVLSYFIYNSKEIKEVLEEIYNVKDPNLN